MAVPYVDVIAWNYAEGGAAGANATSGTTGGDSGTALNVQLGGTSTIIFDATAPIQGTRSYRVTSVGGFALLRWLTNVVGALTTSCGVMYVKLNALPTGYTDIVAAYAADAGGSANKCFAIKVNSSGNIRLTDSAEVAVATGTAPVSVGSVYRIEWQINHATGAYVVEWFAQHGTTPIQQLTGTASTNGFRDATRRVDFGRGGPPDLDAWFDLMAIDTEKIGPAFVAGTSSKPYDVVANAGGYSAVGGSVLGALRDESDATYVQSPNDPASASVRYKLEPFSRSDIVTVHTRNVASGAGTTIQRRIQIFNGATQLANDVFNLTTTVTARATATSSSVPAGVELEVLITDTVV